MRTMLVLGAGAALMTAGTVAAQAPGAPFPHPGQGVRIPMPQAPRVPVVQRQQRWGSQIGGRWWGGANAPGGWSAYRQPYRGYRVPTYWVAPRFYVSDWSRYGLYQPAGGYNWVRYYDDAILVDRTGNVSDWRGGLDWDGYDRSEGYYAHEGEARGSYSHGGHDQRGEQRPGGSSGAAGAVAGAVVGGVAGNVIAGRGNRLGGTLLGAGVGAAVGYGIDRAANRDRRGPGGDERPREDMRVESDRDPREVRRVIIRREDGSEMRRDGGSDRGGAGYPPPPHGSYRGGSSSWGSQGGTTTTTTTGGYGQSYGNVAPVIVRPGYGGSTTIIVQNAPVVTTTTTTETIEDTVTYSRPTVRRPAVRARTWHARPRVKVRPRCVCR